jgi:hypothetical protein
VTPGGESPFDFQRIDKPWKTRAKPRLMKAAIEKIFMQEKSTGSRVEHFHQTSPPAEHSM